MAHKVLLVCNDHDEAVSVPPTHSYAVRDGFCLVDVDPYIAAGEATADAAIDAAHLLALPGATPYGPKFRAASATDVAAWQAMQAGGPAPARAPLPGAPTPLADAVIPDAPAPDAAAPAPDAAAAPVDVSTPDAGGTAAKAGK